MLAAAKNVDEKIFWKRDEGGILIRTLPTILSYLVLYVLNSGMYVTSLVSHFDSYLDILYIVNFVQTNQCAWKAAAFVA